jgi:tripartite-type tricarboxylate transporter receptor subunit TctC
MISRRHSVAGSLVGAAGFWQNTSRPVAAQAVRNPARLMVGFPPGGSSDVVARLLVNEMKSYAPSLIVDNRPGAGGRIALDALKGAAADGTVFLLTPASMLVLYPHIYRHLNYDPFADFAAVTSVCLFPYLLTVGPLVPAEVKTLADFIAWCRANPRQSAYGTAGAGSALHFTGVTLARIAGFEFVHLPFQGAAPAAQNLLGGQIAATILPPDVTLPHIRSGTVRALATTGPQRSPAFPDVPTVREAGYAALEAVEWFGIVVPARTPVGIVEKLNGTVREALNAVEIKAGLARFAFEPFATAPADFAQRIRTDYDRWGPIVQASGFRPED